MSDTPKIIMVPSEFGKDLETREDALLALQKLTSELAALRVQNEITLRDNADQRQRIVTLEGLLVEEQRKNAEQAKRIEELEAEKEHINAHRWETVITCGNVLTELRTELDTSNSALEATAAILREARADAMRNNRYKTARAITAALAATGKGEA